MNKMKKTLKHREVRKEKGGLSVRLVKIIFANLLTIQLIFASIHGSYYTF